MPLLPPSLPPTDPAALRRNAEARIKNRRATISPPAGADPKRFQHELEVHNVELDMQSESLVATQVALQAALERYTDLYDFAPVGYLSLKCDGEIRQLNFAAATLLGAESSRLVGRRLGQFLGQADRVAFADFLEGAFGGQSQTCEVTLAEGVASPQGVRMDAVSMPSRHECQVAMTDITERRRAEKALRVEAERRRILFEQLPDGVLVIDPQTARFVEFNTAAHQQLGYSREEFARLTVLDVEAQKTASETRAHIAGVLQTGRADFETLQRTRQGEIRTVQVTAQLLDVEGQQHYQCVWRDITAQKQAAEHLRQTNQSIEAAYARATALTEQANAANRAKSEFLANMSHEMRTPMNGIIGMTGLLLGTTLDPAQRHYAETVRLSGQVLLQLINDILVLSKIEASKLELETVDFDLQELLGDLAVTMAFNAAKKGVEFLCAAEPEVPQFLRGDSGRLQQVLTNLAGNALKFTAHGEVFVRASMESESAGEACLRFSVRDTGIGIPVDKLGLLFEKFSQVDTAITRNYGGTGLGLAISKRLVEQMGGSIGVTSEAGKGSEFWFTVRLQRPPGKPHRQEAPVALSGIPVLVVHDQATRRRLLCCQLVSWGLAPAEAADAASALDLLNQAAVAGKPFRVAIVDIGSAGLALGRAVRTEPRLAGIALVLVAALDGEHDIIVLDEVADVCLFQPIRPRELLAGLLASVTGQIPAAPAPGPGPQAHLPGRLGRARVLVADDNVINREVALGILQKLGVSADVVANGHEALRALAITHYDLVFMDVRMPVLDGLAATRQIRQREAKASRRPAAPSQDGVLSLRGPLPIVAMTAHAFAEDRESCLAAGMNDYISKPVTPEMLMKILRKWLPGAEGGNPKTENREPQEIRDPKSEIREPSDELGEAKAEILTHRNTETPPLAVYDRAAFLARLTEDESFLHTIEKRFVQQTRGRMETLRNCVVRGEVKPAGALAHKIRGAAAEISAEALREAAARMERAAEAEDAAALQKPLLELEDEWRKLEAALKGC